MSGARQVGVDDDLTVVLHADEQCIVAWDGKTARFFRDDMDPNPLVNVDAMTVVQRAVLSARLRAWADRVAP